MEKESVKIGPISKDLLYIKIADAIFSYAKANKMKPGDKLPSERSMADLFQASRNSVREALHVLETRGLIEIKMGCGTYIKTLSDGSDSVYFRLVKLDFLEIQEMKIALEQLAVHKAMSVPMSEKDKLLEIAKEMTQMANEGKYSNDVDHKFHTKLLEIAGNRTVQQLVTQMREEVFDKYWALIEYDDSKWINTVPYHQEMAEAICAGDEDAAIKALYKIDGCTKAVLAKAKAKQHD
jgi:GntR family transcriptional repressor for pyruvate dehydrogenase complex